LSKRKKGCEDRRPIEQVGREGRAKVAVGFKTGQTFSPITKDEIWGETFPASNN